MEWFLYVDSFIKIQRLSNDAECAYKGFIRIWTFTVLDLLKSWKIHRSDIKYKISGGGKLFSVLNVFQEVNNFSVCVELENIVEGFDLINLINWYFSIKIYTELKYFLLVSKIMVSG